MRIPPNGRIRSILSQLIILLFFEALRSANKESIKYVDAIFTWGKLDYDNLKRTYPQYKTKLINTGNPRIDFWRSDFSNFYDKS